MRDLLMSTLALFEQLGDKSGIGYTMRDLARLSWNLGLHRESIVYLLGAQEHLQEVGEWIAAVSINYGLSHEYIYIGEFDTAFRFLRAMAQTFLDMGHNVRAAHALSDESISALRYSTVDHARQTRLRSLALYQEAGHPLGTAWATWEMGEIEQVAGNFKESA